MTPHPSDVKAAGGRRASADALLRAYDRLDAALVAKGWHPTSPWWRREIERFVRSERRRWVARVGRRGGKSETCCRLGVVQALWGAWRVQPGDVGVVAFVSVDRNEASARLRTIAAILRALGVGFVERGEELELKKKPIVFRVVTCSIRGVVGFTSIAIFCDEMARWESRDEQAANPARAVVGSLRPTMVTQRGAFELDVSSPWGTDDFHAELFEQGDTKHQVVSFAPTWVANPSVSETETHDDEPDEKVWSREYGATPGVTLTAAFDPVDLKACFTGTPSGIERERGFLAIDASSLRGDAFAWVSGAETDDGEIVVRAAGGWSGDELRRTSMDRIVRDLAKLAREIGARTIFADQHERGSLSAMFAEQHVTLHPYAWTPESKDAAVMQVRRWMRERKLFLPEHRTLRRELSGLRARLMPSGLTRYETNGLDFASALITLAHAAVDGRLGGESMREFYRALNAGALPRRREARRAHPQEVLFVQDLLMKGAGRRRLGGY